MKKLKENAGITLIALVITIIILIILAGIGISAITGDGGIIRKTQIAVNINELANLKEALDIYYVLNPNDDPVTTQVPKEEITDEVTQTKIVEYQPDVNFITDIKYERLYYLDSEKLNVNDLPEKRYILDIETGVVFVNNGLEVKEDGTKTYVLAEYERDKNKTNILAEGTKIYTANNNTYVVKENGDMYGVGEIGSYNNLGLEWKEEYDIEFTPQKTDIQIIPEDQATDDDFIKVVCSANTYIFQKKNGEIWGVGNNQYGQLGLGDRVDRTELTKIPIDNVKDIKILSQQDDHAGTIYYLKNDGTLWASGKNHYYTWGAEPCPVIMQSDKPIFTQPVQITYKTNNNVEVFSDIKDFTVSVVGVILIKNNGEIWSGYGEDKHGRFGGSAVEEIIDPFRITVIENLASSNNTSVKQIVTGSTTAVLLENGDVYTVGRNDMGQAGQGDSTTTKLTFEKVLDNAEYIFSDNERVQTTYAIKNNGETYGWGITVGSTNTNENVTVPTLINISSIKNIKKYAYFSYSYNFNAITENGDVYQLYYNADNIYNKKIENLKAKELLEYGIIDEQNYLWTYGNVLLKDKGKKIYLSKSNISNIQEFYVTPTQGDVMMYKSTDGKIYGWGNNSHYVINNSSLRKCVQANEITFEGIISKINYQYLVSSVIDSNGNVWFKGNNNDAQFAGSLVTGWYKDYVKIANINNIKQTWLYSSQGTFVQKQDGTLWFCGIKSKGLSGIESRPYSYTQINKDINNNEIDFSNLKKFTQEACFTNSVIALLEDGTIYTWGENTYGQLGLGHYNDVARPTKLTFFEEIGEKVIDVDRLKNTHIFLTESGDVYLSGSNTYGQFGNGTRNDSNIPVKANIENVKEIHAGNNHIIAIKNDNSVWSWGAGAQGQLGNAKIGDELTPVPAYELAR